MNRSAYAQQLDRQLGPPRDLASPAAGEPGHTPHVSLRGVPHKSCCRCARLKPADREHFGRDLARWDGLRGHCKECER